MNMHGKVLKRRQEIICYDYYGRSGIASHPLYGVNRLKVFVDGQEADAAILGQNYNIDNDGEV